MMTPVEIIRNAIALILPNSPAETRDKFLVNLVTQSIYCSQCDYEGLKDGPIDECPRCHLPIT